MAIGTRRASARLLSLAWAVLACLGLLLALPRTAYAVAAFDPDLLPEGVSPACHSYTFDRITYDDLLAAGTNATDGLLTAPIDGTEVDANTSIPLVMIVIGFDNLAYEDTFDWGARVFQDARSLTQYYLDMSLGKFTFVPATESSATGVDDNTNEFDQLNDGVVHVKLNRDKTAPWYANSIRDDNFEMMDSFAEALVAADPYVGFASYDTDGDGYLQTSELAVGFVVAGKDAAYGESVVPSNGYKITWPHGQTFTMMRELYGTREAPDVNGVVVENYIAIAETARVHYPTYEQESIGTLAHELGHYLGLPDLYDTTGMYSGSWTAYKVDYLSLMCSGSYGFDFDGNSIPYSLDMWSRVWLGWVDPVEIDDDTSDPSEIAGSLTSGETPIAYKLESGCSGEYYLFENRRFTSWDEYLSTENYYPDAALPDNSGGDLGGGIIVWHVDNAILDKHMDNDTVNDYGHHPGVTPIFLEADGAGNLSTIGGSVQRKMALFSADTWDQNLNLPTYGKVEEDLPPDRRLWSDLILWFDSGSAPVQTFHRHDLYLLVSWASDHSSATMKGYCFIEDEYVEVETTTNVTTEVVKKPSSTESGTLAQTAHFELDFWDETVYTVIPPLDAEALSARDMALEGLSELIRDANATLATGAYTVESFAALDEAIDAANTLFEDDTTTADDVAVAQAELLRRWRLLEAVNTAALGPSEAELEAERRQAAYELAECLGGVYDSLDPEAYRPEALATFMETVDGAHSLLTNPDATTQELRDAKTAIVLAEAQLKRDGKRTSIKNAIISGLGKMAYTGDALEPEPTVVLGGVELVADTDYTVSYADNVEPGTATATVTGRGDYTGTATATFAIRKTSLEAATIGRLDTMTYTGLACEPAPTVVLGDVGLVAGTDFSVSYADNVEPGTATVSVRGLGIYEGTATATFTIRKTVWERLAGATAVETMREIVRADGVFTAKTVSTVVVAGRRDFRGALAGTALAGLYGAPLVTTDGNAGSLSVPARDELKRLAPSRVIVVGDASAVPEKHVKGIKSALPKAAVSRVSGKGASAVAVGVATVGKVAPVKWGKTCIVATPASFKDAMSIAPYAYARHAPVFYTESGKIGDGKGLSAATVRAIRAGGFTSVLIVGGELAVPPSVEGQLAGITCQRLAGANAIETCKAIAEYELQNGMNRRYLSVATTKDYADALAGAALAGAQNSVLVLADPEGGLDAFDAVYRNAELVRGHILGGPVSVSRANETYFREK